MAPNDRIDMEGSCFGLKRGEGWWVLGMVAFAALIVLSYRVLEPVQGLGNNDVAGIVYNADIILHGGLPYVDSIEIKPPASFFLVAGIFAVAGRSVEVLHFASLLWLILGALGVGWAARELYGDFAPGRAVWPVLAAVVYLVAGAKFAANYSSWMATPYAWSVALTLVALRVGGWRWHAAAAGMACTAYLFKNHAVVLGAFIIFSWLWARHRQFKGARGYAWPAWLAGIAVALSPWLLLYARRSALGPLLRGILPFEQADRYVARVIDAGPIEVVVGLSGQAYRAFPAAMSLSIFVVIVLFVSRNQSTFERERLGTYPPVFPQLLLVALSVLGCGLGGMRYYAHYLIQYAAGLALLAAHPLPYYSWRQSWKALEFEVLRPLQLSWPPVGSMARSRRRLQVFIVLLAIIPCLGVGSRFARVFNGREGRDYRPGRDPERIGAMIRARSEPTDRVFCWGWRTWSVYFWAERRSPTALYKSLGTLTEFNNNGKFEPAKAERDRFLDFYPGPVADDLLVTFRQRPPKFLVRARRFFPGMLNDPIEQFPALQAIWTDEYRLVEDFRHMQLYERIERRAPALARASANEDAALSPSKRRIVD